MRQPGTNRESYDIGFDQAVDMAMSCVIPMASEMVSPALAAGRACAETLYAAVDSPSLDVSVKDGYAVVSADLTNASRNNPITLQIIDSVSAGGQSSAVVSRGKAIQVLSGAPIPVGADAVLAEEFAEPGNDVIRAVADAEPGRNILRQGIDVAAGETLVEAGRELTPSIIGRLVGGGISEVPVHQRPRVGLLGTGDEVLLPGSTPQAGKLFASNLALQQAWFSSRGIQAEARVAGDSMESLTRAVQEMLPESDVIITSGGAWKGNRDLIVTVLESLGWELKFHRVRMGPGKAVGMGLLEGKPVFCLPGGPPSN
ncbi:MAG: molybdopterin molybdotransferase MoeA, partial [Deltaproteobacteria bacterium]